jgi:hypothetical protein
MRHSSNIAGLYFEFRPVLGHRPSCSLAETSTWEVSRYEWYSFNGEEIRETTLRYACHECGVVLFETVGTGTERQRTHGSEIGYGSPAERLRIKGLELWLWPGPRILAGDKNGPTSFYVTLVNERPRSPDDILGSVGWGSGRRGAIYWAAGCGCPSYGSIKVSSGGKYRSKGAAAGWIAEQVLAVTEDPGLIRSLQRDGIAVGAAGPVSLTGFIEQTVSRIEAALQVKEQPEEQGESGS